MKLSHILWNKYLLLYIFHIAYFNFRCLPFKQAIKFPILIYKPKFYELEGKIEIKGKVSFGMIQLGFNRVPLFPNSGCMICNSGKIIFHGRAKLGNDVKIVVGKNGTLEFGANFNSTAASKYVCYNHVVFGDNTLVGWDCLFSDYDFHRLKSREGDYNKGIGSICVGHDSWFACGCRIYKNVSLPPNTVISANTIMSNYTQKSEFCLLGNDINLKIKKSGIWHDMFDDKIE